MRNAVSDALLGTVPGEGRPTVAGFFWMQGEADAQDLAAASAYTVNLRRLVARLRWEFSMDRLPVIIGRIRADDPAASRQGLELVRTATDSVGGSTPNATTVSTDALSLAPDRVHFDGPGLIRLGTEFADAYLTLDR
jgi:hypothetical protein